ncbi:hypothetical protein CQW23_32572 [Capsicum baccatum]|uniref:Uncharacterized protein n=1 Tax=Capsicum baccatum TaxID=33114 RepID=A0A2G2V4F3_CAPBA|nr:hypothetical protein CQW23_32572 [Capsicum baccatum]
MPCRALLSALEGFRSKDKNSSVSSSGGYGSSVKCSSSADAGYLGNSTVPFIGDGRTWNNIEGINSDKSIDSGRPSLALCSSSCLSVDQEPEPKLGNVSTVLVVIFYIVYSSLFLCGKLYHSMNEIVKIKNSSEPASPAVANSEKIGIAVTLGNLISPLVSETTTTQDAVLYGDGFSSENRELLCPLKYLCD